MGSVLCTFPGRYGDLLWALPAIRAIAESGGEPVDLQIAGEFAGILPLLQTCPYLGRVLADPRWATTPPNEWMAPTPFHRYDHIYQLGYRGWPQRPLPEETYLQAVAQVGRELPPLDLTRRWIASPLSAAHQRQIVYGFTDCHFELKYGLTELLYPEYTSSDVIGIFPAGSRWTTEGIRYQPTTWVEAAQWVANAQLLLSDCSALHVLAVALGIPVVVVEPMEARGNPIFYPCGGDGPQVTVVRGLDGLPTFDARHTAETIAEVLRARVL